MTVVDNEEICMYKNKMITINHLFSYKFQTLQIESFKYSNSKLRQLPFEYFKEIHWRPPHVQIIHTLIIETVAAKSNLLIITKNRKYEQFINNRRNLKVVKIQTTRKHSS